MEIFEKLREIFRDYQCSDEECNELLRSVRERDVE